MTHLVGGKDPNGFVPFSDKRRLYEIEMDAVLDEVQSVCGTGEVEKTGRTVDQRIVVHVIATTEANAMALYQHQYGGKFLRRTFVSIRELYLIDGEMITRRD